MSDRHAGRTHDPIVNPMTPQTAATLGRIVTVCFVGTWIALAAGGFYLFHLGNDAAHKRRWFPRFIVLGGVLFAAFTTILGLLAKRSPEGLKGLLVVGPAVLIISYLNIKSHKFCDGCGATTYNKNLFAPARFCPRCGASLGPKPAMHDDLLGWSSVCRAILTRPSPRLRSTPRSSTKPG